ncbi:MAG: glycosyltransferase [Chitinophagaceae bacterium]|nr:MAG: glycosyltransferase [Chitinophagaceae bacterium]
MDQPGEKTIHPNPAGMKVLVIHCAYGHSGGEDSVVREEMELLRNQGVEVQLLGFDNNRHKMRDLLLLPFNFFSYSRVRRACRRFKPDLAHVHNTHFAGSGSVFAALKKSNLPFVATLHNYRLLCPSAILYNNGQLFLDSVNSAFPWKAIREKVYRNSMLLTAWLAIGNKINRAMGLYTLPAKYIVLTSFAKNIFNRSSVSIPDEKIVVKPNFVTDRGSKPATRNSDFLFIGRLTEDKGIPVLLEAFAGSPHRVRIAGDGPLRPMVEKYAKQHANIEYLGHVTPGVAGELLSTASALVFPSNWYEGMPMTIIEAFAAGCPVIASDLGAMHAMITDGVNGKHFNPGEAASLSRALDQWSAMDVHTQSIYGKEARAIYEKLYSPEENARQLMAIYSDTLHPD